MRANGSALLRYAMIISVRKITQVIKSNTAGFLRIQRKVQVQESTSTGKYKQESTKENTKKTTEINWD